MLPDARMEWAFKFKDGSSSIFLQPEPSQASSSPIFLQPEPRQANWLNTKRKRAAFVKLIGQDLGAAAPSSVLTGLVMITSSLLSVVTVEVIGPLFLESILFPILNLEKYLPPPLLWLLSHNSVFSHEKIPPPPYRHTFPGSESWLLWSLETFWNNCPTSEGCRTSLLIPLCHPSRMLPSSQRWWK